MVRAGIHGRNVCYCGSILLFDFIHIPACSKGRLLCSHGTLRDVTNRRYITHRE